MSSETTVNEEYVYAMPKTLQAILILISAIWVSINGIPLAPVGLLAAIVVIAQKYDFTYFGSLRKGWRMLALCGAVAAVTCFARAAEAGLFR